MVFCEIRDELGSRRGKRIPDPDLTTKRIYKYLVEGKCRPFNWKMGFSGRFKAVFELRFDNFVVRNTNILN